jgi:iron(III) transport system permease protein
MSATLTPGVEAPAATPRAKKGLKQPDFWTIVSLALLLLFGAFLIYPLFGVLKESVVNGEGDFTLEYFVTFFAKSYYFQTITNSFVLSIAVTLVSLAIGIPFSYFYTYFKLRGQKLLFIGAVLSCMSAPFIGAYAWILLMGRSGLVTQVMGAILPWIEMGSIYGFGGLVLVLSLKLFPLVSVYMNGAFRSIDNSLLEAASLMGSSGLKRIMFVTLRLTVPTMLAASLLVFMRTFADFGTPLLIGEGFRTFTVEIYNQYLGEAGGNHNFAAAIGMIGVFVTAVVFWFQKYAAGKFSFTLKASSPIVRVKPRGIGGVFIYVYMYALVGLALLPQIYVMYLSFRNSNASVFLPGYSFDNYVLAMDRLLIRSTLNTLWFGFISMVIIIVLSVLIAYLVVRRSNAVNNFLDTMAMIPYILPGAVIGIALVIAFNGAPLALTGTAAIMILALVIRRMPYTIRSATATLMHIPMSMEEASRSLGASKFKTFRKITVPMMANGITSGAILSFVAIVTEMAAGIILYNNQTITLTMSAYVAITRGNYGLACAFATVLTVLTALVLLVYLRFTREEDVKM